METEQPVGRPRQPIALAEEVVLHAAARLRRDVVEDEPHHRWQQRETFVEFAMVEVVNPPTVDRGDRGKELPGVFAGSGAVCPVLARALGPRLEIVGGLRELRGRRIDEPTGDLLDSRDPARERERLRTLFVATLLNPKALLFAGTIFPAAAFANGAAYLLAMSVFVCLLVPAALAWIAFGAALGNGKLTWVNPSKVQRGASIVLGVFSLSLAWAAFH